MDKQCPHPAVYDAGMCCGKCEAKGEQPAPIASNIAAWLKLIPARPSVRTGRN